jgi:hypothetical protein
MIRLNLTCISEGSPTKFKGDANGEPFRFYYKHGIWTIEFDNTSTFEEGEIGHSESDDMPELVAVSLIVYWIATIYKDPEIELFRIYPKEED